MSKQQFRKTAFKSDRTSREERYWFFKHEIRWETDHERDTFFK